MGTAIDLQRPRGVARSSSASSAAEEGAGLFETKKEWESVYGPTFVVDSWEPRTSVPTERWRAHLVANVESQHCSYQDIIFEEVLVPFLEGD